MRNSANSLFSLIIQGRESSSESPSVSAELYVRVCCSCVAGPVHPEDEGEAREAHGADEELKANCRRYSRRWKKGTTRWEPL